MKEYKLPRKTLHLWQLRATAAWLLLIALCGFYAFKIKPLLITLSLITFLFVLMIFWYLPKYFSCCRIRFFGDAVVLEEGVFFKNTHILPFSRLIYTQTLVTPLARLLGVKALTLKAARSRVFIPELKNEDAEMLVAEISKGGAE